METKQDQKSVRAKVTNVSTTPIRVKRDTKKRIAIELGKINKKDFGKRIKPDELINLALSLVEAKHILELQESSLSNADRFDRQYRDYVKKHGATTKDEFLGRVLSTSVAAANGDVPHMGN